MSNLSYIERQVKQAIEILRSGGTIAYPTDTVYGLGADPLNKRAVDKIYRVKRRPYNQALPLLLADKSDFTKVASEVPDIAWKLAERFFPGGLTLVLKRSSWVPGTVAGGGNTIAVRVPNHPVPIALIKALGNPIVGTSANVSGRPSPVTAAEVREQLGREVDLIVDGGRCPGGTDSTVLDVSGRTPVLVREGAVPRKELEKICGPLLPKPR